MKKADIKVGAKYYAKISGRIVPVIVNGVRETFGHLPHHSSRDVYDVTNLVTGRKVVFRSAAKFRSLVKEKPATEYQIETTQRPMRIAAKSRAEAETVAQQDGHQLIRVEPKTDSLHPEGL